MDHFYPSPPAPSTASQSTQQSSVATASQVEETVLTSYPDEPKKEDSLTEEKLFTLSNHLMTVEFSTYGGAIKRVVLKKHKAQDDEPLILNRGAKLPMLNLEGWNGDLSIVGYHVVAQSDKSIAFERKLEEGIRVLRTYTLLGDYSIKLEQIVENAGSKPVNVPSYWMQVGLGEPIYTDESSSARRYITGAWLTTADKYQSHPITEFDSGGLIFKSKGKLFVDSNPSDRIRWACAKNQFFTTNLASLDEPALKADLRKVVLTDLKAGEGKIPEAVQTKMQFAGFEVPAGGVATKNFEIYAGPKQDSLLKKLPFNQDRVMEFGWLGWISRPMLAVMNFINSFVHNYGVTIIILTILIKAVLWVPQTRANVSMRKTQMLAPKLKEFQDKYKDQPQKLQEEMMKLYRDYDVNPLGGCLPLLAQMPIFIGFYYMLLSAVELRHASFLWISDLSQPDTVARLPIPGFAIPINPMPLLMGATMFWSMNVTPQPKGVDNPAANMMKIMPLVILVICYNFSAALSLYWTVQNLLSIVQMYYNLHQPMPTLEKVKHAAVKKKSSWMAMLQEAREQQMKAQKKRK